MLTGDGRWSMGVLIGMPVIGLIVFICIVAIVGGLFWERRNYSDGEGTVVAVFSTMILVITLGLAAFGYFPYKEHYHKWMTVKGTVETTNKRIVRSGEGVAERYVIKFNESRTLYGCDDTRCGLAEKGKTLQLACKKEYEYGSQPGWACRYGSSE